MKLRPLNDTLIVEPDPPISEVDTFLVIPDKNTVVKRSHYATVVSAGSKCSYNFKPGQRVVLDRWFCQKGDDYFEWEGKRYRFILEHYLHAVVE